MDHVFYKQQIERLKAQWPQAYSEERMIIFFNAFRDVSNFDFRDAVTHCLATCKGAPLLGEITEAIVKAKNNYLYQKRLEESKMMGALDYAYENNTTADPEFVDRCMKLLDDLYNKKITKAQFDQGCDLLDQAAKLYSKPKTKTKIPEKYKKPIFEEDKPF